MEKVREIAERVKAFVGEGRSEEEIVQFLSPFLKTGDETATRLADLFSGIPDGAAAAILQRMLGEVREKEARRGIKRLLYRLKAKGISVREVSQDAGRSVLRPVQAEPPEGFGTGLDPVGHRLLILRIPHAGRGMTVMHGVVSDTRGLINFRGEEMTRKEAKAFLEGLQEETSGFPLVEMEAPYVASLFDKAHRLTLERKGTPPQDYLHLKNEIQKLKRDYPKPLVYEYLSREEMERESRWFQGGEDSLEKGVLIPWILEENLIAPFAGTFVETRGSRLFLNQSQKEARLQEVYLQAVTEIFTEERRRLYRSRLEETAYLFYRLGKEEEAKTALAVAIEFEMPINPIQPNPFLLQLAAESIRHFVAAADEEREKEASLIVRP
jgi:hypothetical protein